MNRLLRDTPLLVWAVLWSSSVSCGGKTADEFPDVVLRSTDVPSGGTGAFSGGRGATTGGGHVTGGAATGGAATGGTTMGAVGCANRSVVYADDMQFRFASGRGISGLDECTPTCGQPYGSYQSMPAGPCDEDPECVMMMAGGIPQYFLCSCANRWWSCVEVSGAP